MVGRVIGGETKTGIYKLTNTTNGLIYIGNSFLLYNHRIKKTTQNLLLQVLFLIIFPYLNELKIHIAHYQLNNRSHIKIFVKS